MKISIEIKKSDKKLDKKSNLINFSEFAEFAAIFAFEDALAIAISSQKYEKLCKTKAFEGKLMQSVQLQENGKTILVIGLGKKADFDNEFLRRGASLAYKTANAMKADKLNIFIPKINAKSNMQENTQKKMRERMREKKINEEKIVETIISEREMVQAITEGAILANYPLDKYKTEERKKLKCETELVVCGKNKIEINEGIKLGKIMGEAQNYVRDLNERPANIMSPSVFAEEAKRLSKQYGMKIKILEKKELEKKGMNGIISAGKGSINEPVLICVEYKDTTTPATPFYCIVGKGVIFDSGGISIKPSKGMQEMKYDKSGACIVLGVLKAAAELKLPIRLLGIMPVVENMPSGAASKPGDIITMYSRKTVEIMNTDAEGRLVLADALAYAAEKKPSVIIDVATLTGAIITCLGRHAIGLFSNDSELAEKIKTAGMKTYERVWEFPLWKEYSEMIEGSFADISNGGSETGEAGSITAAVFLKEFVNEIKWAHIDIAGVFNVIGKHALIEKGATGTGTRLIIQSIIELSKKKENKEK
ncbi:MAG: leucyl aminopeptidase family protein [Candidatus Micrarchaeota archaeon]